MKSLVKVIVFIKLLVYGMVSVLKVPISSLFVFFVFQFESKYHQMHFRGKFSFALRLDLKFFFKVQFHFFPKVNSLC